MSVSEPSLGVSPHFVEDVARALRLSAKRPGVVLLEEKEARRVAVAIAACVDEYRRDRSRENNEAAAAVRRWLSETAAAVETLKQRILTGPPCPCGATVGDHDCEYRHRVNADFVDELRSKSQRTGTELHHFLTWLRWTHDEEAPAHRHTDWTRAHLEEGVGFELFSAGIRLTASREGVYARILEHVYDEIGLDAEKVSPKKAIERALERHAEWRTSVTVR